MSEFSCNTVRDMLPLYVDNIVSDDTRAIVEEHLTSCDACRKEYENMKNAFVLPADGDAKQLKRFKGAWKKKKRLKMEILQKHHCCTKNRRVWKKN